MSVPIDVHQVLDVEMGVALGGAEPGMAEQFLKRSQISTRL